MRELLNPKPYCRRYSLRDPVGARAESLLLPASFESFSSAASVASSVSAAMSPSSGFFFLDSFFTVNRPSRLPAHVYTFPLLPCKGTWLPVSYSKGFARHYQLVQVLSKS